MVEITGENFSPGLSVWFGEIESPSTEYQYESFSFQSQFHIHSLIL